MSILPDMASTTSTTLMSDMAPTTSTATTPLPTTNVARDDKKVGIAIGISSATLGVVVIVIVAGVVIAAAMNGACRCKKLTMINEMAEQKDNVTQNMYNESQRSDSTKHIDRSRAGSASPDPPLV